ncbi:SMC-Scp complex subunit ScpB [Prescottella sp. R16]|uniref:SMC-Scp complex subunit ScpB n=1 Tax=Prescottella sp. R16 TaxID=3064529 RepID=UPI00272ECEE4|nr:SMC-Scp complex subunit ScpB [Prescottella sp. R16]
MSAFEDEFTGEPDRLTDERLAAALESMLLVVDEPATAAILADAAGEPAERVETMLHTLSARYTEDGSGIDLRCSGDGWRLYTRTEYAPYVERLLQGGARTKLTRAALETLAVIAYRQPLTRARIGAVRGVNVDGVVRTLLARGLIVEAGPDPETHATTYATTELFLERLGLSSLHDLPPLAPLLPDVDVIDDIAGIIEADPRFARMDTTASSSEPATTDSGFDTEH